MKRSIVVIINPIAGVRPKDEIPAIVREILTPDLFDVTIRFTEYAGHASEIAKEAVRNNIDTVVAIGGDGTINETAKCLIGSNTALGIVPMGSGNGLARHRRIPLELSRALQVVKEGYRDCIDYGDVNGHIFFCTAGVGFDAVVSHEFAEKKGRGPINYAKSAIDVFSNYNPMTYAIYTDDDKFNEKAFLIAIGNAAQWGNNAFITPQASMHDGMLDITIVEPFPMVEAPQMAMQLFNRTLNDNQHVKTHRSENIRIVSPKPNNIVHVDGEPFEMNGILHIGCHHAGLYILIPKEPMSNVLEPIQFAIEDIHYSIWNNVRNGVKQIETFNNNLLDEIAKAVEPIAKAVEQIEKTIDEAIEKAVVEPIEQLKKTISGSKKKEKK